jgi:glucans biosynthesis protein
MLRTLLCFSWLGLAGVSVEGAQMVESQVVDFSTLTRFVAEKALLPYESPGENLDLFFKELNYDGHRKINFRKEKSFFGPTDLTYRVEFSHPGWMFKKPVKFYNVQINQTMLIPFDRQMFDYQTLEVPNGIKDPEGYAGFKLVAPGSFSKDRFEFLVFMGASYYRAITTDLGWGISARGVAVNTIGGQPEEFPDFTHFWFVEPNVKDEAFRFYAMLDGPSVVGAYEFEVLPGKKTEMRVKATLFLRKPVTMLGIAPFSSMFWYGENSHPKPYDFRPEVHDSDGLQIEVEGGPSIWRPLDNGNDMRLSFFYADKLKGFGLAQRDRDYKKYEDLEADYHRRPGVWVEPISGFERGEVSLIELSTGEETWDNIVTMWKPAELPKSPKEPLKFEYKLTWLDEHLPGKLAKVINTQRGYVMKSVEHLYVIDFTKGELARDNPSDWVPEIDVFIANDLAKVVDKRVMYNEETKGWRAFFRLDIPQNQSMLELTAELKNGQDVISERWMYQWRR